MTTELKLHAVHEGGLRVRVAADGHTVLTDYPLPGGGPAEGLTSLQMLLGALASCSTNGLKVLLQKEGAAPRRLEVTATGQRSESHPTVLESIHLDFRVEGTDLHAEALERLLDVAETRLCPVWVMLKAGTPITRTLHTA